MNSLFSLAIYDKKKSTISILRDWPGRIPLYYFFDGKRFIFSSELKAFKSIQDISLQDPLELEPGYIVEFNFKKRIKKNQIL